MTCDLLKCLLNCIQPFGPSREPKSARQGVGPAHGTATSPGGTQQQQQEEKPPKEPKEPKAKKVPVNAQTLDLLGRYVIATELFVDIIQSPIYTSQNACISYLI